MRMRNKPWANEFLSHCAQVHFDPTALKGQWGRRFGYATVVLEIGSGKGDYATQMAKLQPDVLWIALEKDKNVSAVAQKKIQDDLPPNLHWIVGDASDLEKWFDVQEISRLHLNFSDPWPKRGHEKRRLTSDGFVQRMLKVGTLDLSFHFKTDNVALFEYTILHWSQYDFDLLEFSVNYRRDAHPEDALTEYERHFMELGQPIFRAVWRRKHAQQ